METAFRAEQVLNEVWEEVRQRFTGVDDLAHGWEHIERVYRLAVSIAHKEEANGFIVGMAALMHDLGRSDRSGGQHHADLSVDLAKEIMEKRQVPTEQQEQILHAIIAHSFSKGIPPRSLEAGIVRDADRLDGLGAVGIARWAITGAVRRDAQTVLYHPQDPFGQEHQLDDKHYMLDHFYSKLLKLEENMITETGRQLAQKRTAYLRGYLAQLKEEIHIQE